MKTSYVSRIKTFLQRFTGIYRHSGAFRSTLSYHRFCVPNAFSYPKDIKKPVGGLQSAVIAPVELGQSLGRGQKGKTLASSVYLGFDNLLL